MLLLQLEARPSQVHLVDSSARPIASSVTLSVSLITNATFLSVGILKVVAYVGVWVCFAENSGIPGIPTPPHRTPAR